MAVVVEAGPVTVRRLGETPDGRGEAALDAIDDAVVLVDERPVDVDDVWRNLLGDLGFGKGSSDDLTIVHPSWWPRFRVERISSAAPAGARCMRRCDVITERMGRPVTVIEIDREVITVARDDALPSVHACHDVDGIVGAVGGCDEVAFDSPAGVDGRDIRRALHGHGIAVRDVTLDDLCAPGPTIAQRPSRRRPVLLLALVALAAAAVVIRPWHHAVMAPDTVALVEGRLGVRVPTQWTVQRVTGGPGSRRLQVSAPGDTGAVLHITAAYVPDSTLHAAAGVLGRAAAAQPAGVFTDLRIGMLAGRDVLTYQEFRPGRVIRWAVLLDGATRIAVGCQSRPGAEETVRPACEDAVRSAREVH